MLPRWAKPLWANTFKGGRGGEEMKQGRKGREKEERGAEKDEIEG